MALKVLQAAKQPTVSVKRHLHQRMAGVQTDRGMTNVHASAVTNMDPRGVFCIRSYALWTIHKPEIPKRFLSTALNMTFQIGSKVEDLIRENMGRDAVVGDWECQSCKQIQEFQKQPYKCPTCSCSVFKYKEVRFTSKVSGISCGVDILFEEGTGKLRIIESKSIDKDQGKALVAPMAEHRVRTALYLRILAESDDPRATMIWQDEATVLYTSKGGYGYADPEVKTWGFADDAFSPMKEYRIKRNDEVTLPAHNLGVAVKAWRAEYADWKSEESGSSPPPELPARICKTSFDPRARSCPLSKECFKEG